MYKPLFGKHVHISGMEHLKVCGGGGIISTWAASEGRRACLEQPDGWLRTRHQHWVVTYFIILGNLRHHIRAPRYLKSAKLTPIIGRRWSGVCVVGVGDGDGDGLSFMCHSEMDKPRWVEVLMSQSSNKNKKHLFKNSKFPVTEPWLLAYLFFVQGNEEWTCPYRGPVTWKLKNLPSDTFWEWGKPLID